MKSVNCSREREKAREERETERQRDRGDKMAVAVAKGIVDRGRGRLIQSRARRKEGRGSVCTVMYVDEVERECRE
jgi:hypothetical protein